MNRKRIEFLFLNIGHTYDHLFMLLFTAVTALALTEEFGVPYGDLIKYGTPGFVAFGACALPAGWLADRWSRRGMMAVFFLGLGATCIAMGFAQTPLELGAGFLLLGVFGSIYHPVGIAMVVEGRRNTGMVLGINGVYGNLGVAVHALVAGLLIDLAGWRAAFVVPGAVAVLTGLLFVAFCRSDRKAAGGDAAAATKEDQPAPIARATLIRIFGVIAVSTALGTMLYHTTTISLPKVFDERLAALASTATEVGVYAAVVFAVASIAQIGVGWLIDRASLRTIFAVIAALQVPLYLLLRELSGAPLLAVSMLVMLFVFGQIPINDALIARITTSAHRSRVYAVKFVLALGVAAAAAPMIGVLHNRFGFGAMFLALAGFAAVMLVAILVLPRTGAVLARPAATG